MANLIEEALSKPRKKEGQANKLENLERSDEVSAIIFDQRMKVAMKPLKKETGD